MAMAPSILIVHGSWHTPAFFDDIRSELSSRGYETVVPWLPTCHLNAVKDFSSIDFYSDSAAIQSALTQLIDNEAKEVLVVAHSYGAAPASDAIISDYIRSKRRSAGQQGGVIGMLALASMLILPGQSIEEAFGGVAPFVQLQENGTITTKDPKDIMFNDLDAQEQDKAVSMLVPSTRGAHTRKLRQAPYQDLPIIYMLCDQDHAIPLALQKAMVLGIQNQGAMVAFTEVVSGHSPYLSHPKVVVETIVSMARALG